MSSEGRNDVASGSAAHDRFGGALILLLAAVTTSAVSEASQFVASIALVLLGVSLLWIYRVAHVNHRLQVIARILVLLALVAVVIAAAQGEDDLYRSLVSIEGLLLALSAPAVIIRRLAMHRRITLQTVAGALSVYLLIGMSIAYLLLAGERALSGPILAGAVGDPLNLSDAVYFGFITLTTIGYGDIAPGNGFARAVAMAGGLIGQLYLVSAVALVVGNLGQVRQDLRGE